MTIRVMDELRAGAILTCRFDYDSGCGDVITCSLNVRATRRRFAVTKQLQVWRLAGRSRKPRDLHHRTFYPIKPLLFLSAIQGCPADLKPCKIRIEPNAERSIRDADRGVVDSKTPAVL